MKRILLITFTILTFMSMVVRTSAKVIPYEVKKLQNNGHAASLEKANMDYINKLILETKEKRLNYNRKPRLLIDMAEEYDSVKVKDAFASDGKKVAFLTFDDGPSQNVTPRILDTLKEYDIKATFFVVGKMAQSNEAIIRRIHSEGHKIGNHTYSHNYGYIYGKVSNLLYEIDLCNSVLKKILGEDFDTKLFRFPGGAFGNKYSSFKSALQEDGYAYVNWNALNGDAEGYGFSKERLIKRLKSTVDGKDHVVILMHDLGSKKTTADALPEVIQYLKSNGYEFKKLN